MSVRVDGESRWKFVLGVLIVAVLLTIAGWGWLKAGAERLWSQSDVREIRHDLVETIDPLEMGPMQEVRAGWASARPEIDGVIGAGEWDRATSVSFDGADRMRPGVAVGKRDPDEDRRRSGTIRRDSNQATFYLMNDGEAGYLAIDVMDDVLDFGDGDVAKHDCVEVSIRGRREEEDGTVETVNRFLLVRGDGRVSVGGLPGGKHAGREKAAGDGFVVEIQWDIAQFGKELGLDVGVIDSDDPENAGTYGGYFWNGSHIDLLNEELELGRAILSSKK